MLFLLRLSNLRLAGGGGTSGKNICSSDVSVRFDLMTYVRPLVPFRIMLDIPIPDDVINDACECDHSSSGTG
uniref:Secreted protein n=1 Tax=Ciona intestinalis TaxID=7719 RepID=H2XNR2_CIOIN